MPEPRRLEPPAADAGTIAAILAGVRTIAVVGASRDPAKQAHRVPAELHRMGFRVIPVNPHADVLFGEVVRRSLADIREPIDVVDVFRPSEEAASVAEQALAIGARALWLQLGIRSEAARTIAEQAGLAFVEDRCLMVEASRHPAGRRRTS